MKSFPTNTTVALTALAIIAATHLAIANTNPVLQANNILPNDSSLSVELDRERTHPPAKTHREKEKGVNLHHHNHQEWQSVGKPGNAIAQLSQTHFQLADGSAQSLSLELLTPLHEGQLHVSIAADSELEILSQQNNWTFDLNHTQEITIPLNVRAANLGSHHLHVIVQHHSENGKAQAKALAAKIQVGEQTVQKRFQKTATSASPPQFASLKAVESIR